MGEGKDEQQEEHISAQHDDEIDKPSASGIHFSWGRAIGVIILALGYQFVMAPYFRAKNSLSGYRPESGDLLLMWGGILLVAILLGFFGGSDDKKE